MFSWFLTAENNSLARGMSSPGDSSPALFFCTAQGWSLFLLVLSSIAGSPLCPPPPLPPLSRVNAGFSLPLMRGVELGAANQKWDQISPCLLSLIVCIYVSAAGAGASGLSPQPAVWGWEMKHQDGADSAWRGPDQSGCNRKMALAPEGKGSKGFD